MISQRVSGVLLSDGQRTALRLADDDAATVFLTYALLTQGTEVHILPSSLLDDWGNEIKTLRLYRWIRENGLHFPRAELFGAGADGRPVQYFVRDLELFARYPAYATTDKSLPIDQWVPLEAVLIPDATAGTPQDATPPDSIPFPLREARLSWWRVAPHHADLSFIGQAQPEGE